MDASLGIRINALPGFSIGLSGGYEICKKALFLLPEDLDGKFTGVSRFWGIDANALKAELDVSYRYGTKLEASAKVGYHRWKTADGGETISYNRPQWEGGVNIRYMPVRPFTLEAGYEFAAGREYSNLGKLSDIHLVHLKASYAFTSWFSLYGLTDNVLNRKYDILYGMPTQGINFMFGVDLKF